MKTIKNVYALFSCDEWKDRKSMGLLAIFSDFGLLKKEVKRMVENGEAEIKTNYIKIEDMELEHLSNIDYICIDKVRLNEVES